MQACICARQVSLSRRGLALRRTNRVQTNSEEKFETLKCHSQHILRQQPQTCQAVGFQQRWRHFDLECLLGQFGLEKSMSNKKREQFLSSF